MVQTAHPAFLPAQLEGEDPSAHRGKVEVSEGCLPLSLCPASPQQTLLPSRSSGVRISHQGEVWDPHCVSMQPSPDGLPTAAAGTGREGK